MALKDILIRTGCGILSIVEAGYHQTITGDIEAMGHSSIAATCYFSGVISEGLSHFESKLSQKIWSSAISGVSSILGFAGIASYGKSPKSISAATFPIVNAGLLVKDVYGLPKAFKDNEKSVYDKLCETETALSDAKREINTLKRELESKNNN